MEVSRSDLGVGKLFSDITPKAREKKEAHTSVFTNGKTPPHHPKQENGLVGAGSEVRWQGVTGQAVNVLTQAKWASQPSPCIRLFAHWEPPQQPLSPKLTPLVSPPIRELLFWDRGFLITVRVQKNHVCWAVLSAENTHVLALGFPGTSRICGFGKRCHPWRQNRTASP